jgi:serine/threonine-protein kinase
VRTGPVVVTDAPAPPVPAASRGRRRWPFVVAAIVALLALTAGGAYAWNNVLVASHTVPNLVGLTEQQATEQIQAKHWKVRKVDGRKDEARKGDVIAQDPPDGKSLEEQKTITITVSLGNTLVTVPTDLAGNTVDEASAKITQAGLVVGSQTKQNDENVPAGSVIGADPATPPQLAKGDPVNLIVSDGPKPRVIPTLGPTTTFDQAAAALAGVQLKAVKAEAFNDTIPAGGFVATDPPAGTAVARDSNVNVIFSKGPQPIPIPRVAGQSVADAAAQLQSAGFTVTGVQGNPSRTVTGTNPPEGTLAQRGTGVVIITRG